METDALNTLVTDAIWRAQELEDRGIRDTSQAWAEVSSIEEKLAKAFPASEVQGQIARAARFAPPSEPATTLARTHWPTPISPRKPRPSLSKGRCVRSWSRTINPAKIFRTFRPSPAL